MPSHEGGVLFQTMGGVRKKTTGRELDDRTYDEFLNDSKLRFLIWNSGGTRWNDWRRSWLKNTRQNWAVEVVNGQSENSGFEMPC